MTTVQEPFGKTHDIAHLIELCKRHDSIFENLYSLSAHKLTRYAVIVRYPDEFYIPSLQEAEESVQIAEDVKKFVLNRMEGENA